MLVELRSSTVYYKSCRFTGHPLLSKVLPSNTTCQEIIHQVYPEKERDVHTYATDTNIKYLRSKVKALSQLAEMTQLKQGIKEY